jgi:hypothetical protein
MAAGSPDPLATDMVINKDQMIEKLAEIFYQTQMLSNDSPLTKDLVGVENSASKIYSDLNIMSNKLKSKEETKGEDEDISESLDETIQDVSILRSNIEKLVNTFEDIRGKLYPIAEKVALIELEKNPFQIPGDPYRRVKLNKDQVIYQIRH